MFDDDARALAARFWPGPLTLVLPVRDGAVASLVTAGLDTVAIRVPAHRAMQALLRACGKPLAAPSANASNRISPTRAEHVLATLDGRIPLVIDDGPTIGGAGIDDRARARSAAAGADHIWTNRCSPAKAGAQSPTQPETWAPAFAGERSCAPGQLAIHYAPRKPLRLNATERTRRRVADRLRRDRRRRHAVRRPATSPKPPRSLFDALHRADASDRAAIAVAPIPDDGIGAAINDRLRRAAHR